MLAAAATRRLMGSHRSQSADRNTANNGLPPALSARLSTREGGGINAASVAVGRRARPQRHVVIFNRFTSFYASTSLLSFSKHIQSEIRSRSADPAPRLAPVSPADNNVDGKTDSAPSGSCDVPSELRPSAVRQPLECNRLRAVYCQHASCSSRFGGRNDSYGRVNVSTPSSCSLVM